MNAVGTRRVDDVLSFGTNAVQAAAQALRADGSGAAISRHHEGEAAAQGLAVLGLNGVQVTGERVDTPRQLGGELVQFAFSAGKDGSLMGSKDAFIREMACLHGIRAGNQEPRHPAMFERAFDADQEMTLDAIDQLKDSASA